MSSKLDNVTIKMTDSDGKVTIITSDKFVKDINEVREVNR